MSKNWYKYNIEDPLKDIVRKLRNEGINTRCSCGHARYIQCDTNDIETELSAIFSVLVTMGVKEYRVNLYCWYTESFYDKVLEIQFPDENGQYYERPVDNPDYKQYDVKR